LKENVEGLYVEKTTSIVDVFLLFERDI